VASGGGSDDDGSLGSQEAAPNEVGPEAAARRMGTAMGMVATLAVGGLGATGRGEAPSVADGAARSPLHGGGGGGGGGGATRSAWTPASALGSSRGPAAAARSGPADKHAFALVLLVDRLLFRGAVVLGSRSFEVRCARRGRDDDGLSFAVWPTQGGRGPRDRMTLVVGDDELELLLLHAPALASRARTKWPALAAVCAPFPRTHRNKQPTSD
jgi:hypothetical protein